MDNQDESIDNSFVKDQEEFFNKIYFKFIINIAFD